MARTKRHKKQQELQQKRLPLSFELYHWGPWILLMLILLFVGAVRFRLLQVPFERDEGEYAYVAQLILQGIPPYIEAYNMKYPGTYAAYAVIMALFGQTHGAVHFGLLLINAATIILVFLVTRHLFDFYTGTVSAAAYALLSVGQSVQGVFANAEHFVVLPVLCGILLLLKGVQRERSLLLFGSGVLFGLGILMKQQGIFFAAFGGLALVWNELQTRPIHGQRAIIRLLLFSLGVAIPLGVTVGIFFIVGAFDKFWFWTFRYAREYVSEVPLSAGIDIFKREFTSVVGTSFLLWIIAGFGLVVLFLNKKVQSRRLFVISLFIFSFLAICPGFYFRKHYFILMLPVVALLIGVAVRSGRDVWGSTGAVVSSLLFIFAFAYTAIVQEDFLFIMNPSEASRATYGSNPFPESLEIAKYIREETSPADRILVFGSEPQIYFYSMRRSATGYIYTYGLMENQKYTMMMQQEMIREIETARPSFIVYVNVSTSWLLRPDSNKSIFEWFNKYVQYYDRVGIIDILALDKTEYRWKNDATRYKPHSNNYLIVFKRKEIPVS